MGESMLTSGLMPLARTADSADSKFLLGLQLEAYVVHAGGAAPGQGNYREVSSAEGTREYGVGPVFRRMCNLQPGHVLVEVD